MRLKFLVASLSIFSFGFFVSGCRKAKSEAPPPRIENVSRGSQDPQEKKPGTFARLLGRDLPPQYGWDGQYSSATTGLSPDVVFDRAMETLRAHSFSIQTEETRRQGGSGRIVGMKPDKSVATVVLNGKAPTQTEVRIKVGTTGDRTGSERLLDEALNQPKPSK